MVISTQLVHAAASHVWDLPPKKQASYDENQVIPHIETD